MADNKFSFSVRLEQHTPIIHFQYHLVGATVRSTEFKPKLDKFLIEHAFGDDPQKYGKFKVGGPKGEHPALDYRLRIKKTGKDIEATKLIPEGSKDFPFFFGNMGKEYKDGNLKGIVFSEGVELEFFSFHSDLITHLRDLLPAFLARTNFGMRQSKGYGSFYIHQDDPLFQSISGASFSFFVRERGWQSAMQKVVWFYQVLRSGINQKNTKAITFEDNRELYVKKHPSSCYCKPVVFLFAKEVLKKQWEKKTIKAHFFNQEYFKRNISYNEASKLGNKFKFIFEQGLPTQLLTHKGESDAESPLFFSHQEPDGQYILVRDVLGLSSEQKWRSYGDADISKSHAMEKDGEYFARKKDDKRLIARFKSPLTFKFIKEGGGYRVYVFSNPIPDGIKGEPFIIRASKVQQQEDLVLFFPDNFSIDQFLDFLKDKENVDVDKLFQIKDREVFPFIKDVFAQIQGHGK